MRIYSKSTVTITPLNNAVITNIKFEKNRTSDTYSQLSLTSSSIGSYDNKSGVWKGQAESGVSFTITSNAQFQTKYIEVTYNIPNADAAPTDLVVTYDGTSINEGEHKVIPTGSTISWNAIGADTFSATAKSDDNSIASADQTMTFDKPGLYMFEVTATNKIGSISQSAEINVVDYNPNAGTEYKLLKSGETLANGDIFTIAGVSSNKWESISKIDNGQSYLDVTGVTVDNDVLTLSDNTLLLKLEIGDDNVPRIKTVNYSSENGYFTRASSGNNLNISTATTESSTKADISSINSNNQATVYIGTGTSGSRVLRYNTNPHRFSCYSSTSSCNPIYIYKQHVTEEVLPEQAVIEHDGVGQFTVTVEPGHYIHYKPVYATMLGEAKSFVQARRAAAAGSALDGDLAVDGKDGWYEHKANTLTLTADPAELAEGQYYVLEAVAHHPLSGKQSLGNAAAVSNTGTTTGIEDVAVDATPADNSIYNLQGQRVGAGYKGIAIVNGKKVILK